MRGLATRASWASTCLAGASRLEPLLLYAESPPAIYFGDAICAGRRHLRSPAVSAVPDQVNARLDEEGAKKDRVELFNFVL